MQADREKWNSRYAEISYKRSLAGPLNSFLTQSGEGLRALDIACGQGQNSLFLAEKGFQVDALDISEVALNQFDHPGINKKQVDFDTHRFPDHYYDLVVNFYFLERRLFPSIISCLKPGGRLIFESFLEERAALSNPDHKLRSQELLYSFLGLKVIYYSEANEKATLVALKTPANPLP